MPGVIGFDCTGGDIFCFFVLALLTSVTELCYVLGELVVLGVRETFPKLDGGFSCS